MRVSYVGAAKQPAAGRRRHGRGGVLQPGGKTNGTGNTAPAFANATAARSFTETVGDAAVATAGNVGAVVTATDGDGDTLTYTLEGADAAKFTVNSSSGQIQDQGRREIRPRGQGELFGDGEGQRPQRRLGHRRGDD